MGLNIQTFLFLLLVPFAAPAKVTCQTSACHQEMGKGPFVHGPMKSQGCTVCHPTTGQNKGPGQHPGLVKMGGKETNKTCYLCHEEFEHQFRNSKSVHKVIPEKSCTSCHNPHQSQNKFLLSASGDFALCLKCHENKADFKQAKHHMIKDMKRGCLSCHEPHASKNEKLFKKDRIVGLCLDCHDKEVTATDQRKIGSILSWNGLPANLQHEPVAKGECFKCHDIHGSTQTGLLQKKYDLNAHPQKGASSSSELCFQCHKADLQDKPRVLNETQFRNGETNLHHLHLMGTSKNRNCSACHTPHGSEQGALIKGNFQYLGWSIPLIYKKNSQGGSCATACHKKMEYSREKAVINETDP
ncbi:cytochrome c3 family protein [Bdellovibrio sp.]|uniref:cytochrome c3 family protein n=1 Tax=Bdellovibrio sp. TaxID=28201 RepID=UPI0039E37A7A